MIWNCRLEILEWLTLVTHLVFQKANSQGVLHTYTFNVLCIPWFRALVTQNLLALGDSNHLSDGTPLQKRISIDPQIKKKKKQKKKRKM